MEKKLNEGKKKFDEVVIPEELNLRVSETIERCREDGHMSKRNYLKVGVLVATLGVGSFGGSLYASESFAKEMYELPIIGAVAKVLTFNKYVEQTDAYTLDVEIPNLSDKEHQAYIDRVNKAINKQVDTLLAEAKQRGTEAKDAFVATGGKAEEFYGVGVYMNYEVKYNVEDVVSFAIYKTETMASAYDTAYFYNLDLKANRRLTLEDFFGKDYKALIDPQIKAQMKERVANQGAAYFDGFEGIKPNQSFYINEKGNCVIVFNEYEIAPGSMGIQEFEVTAPKGFTQLQPQAHYEVKPQILNQGHVTYPQITGYKDQVTQQRINEQLKDVLKKYEAGTYSNLNVYYKLTRIDNEVLSVLYRGSVDIEGLGTKMIQESKNFNMQTGEEIALEKHLAQGDQVGQKLQQLINEKLKEKGITETSIEGLRSYFKDSRIIFYYVVPDDSMQQWVEVEIPLDELRDQLK
ncbi:MAG: DUF3298 domain-containing protein [Cellulosilyticaceae bacterium]